MAYGTVNADIIGTSVAGSNLGAGNATIMKNRIINGAMVIDQRNAGASVTPTNGQYTLDRWYFFITQASKFTTQQNAGSVTPPIGFTNYLGVTSSSAYSVVSGDFFSLQQKIEGYNVADLGWGTANAKTVTLSFWVQSSLTGTFGGSFGNGAANRSYAFTYSIPVANTWTQISITVAGDTTGTWAKDNTAGLAVYFGLGVGSTYSGTAGSWSANNYVSATGATSVVGTNGATFYITGVQLEVGSSATGFEYRMYSTELYNCYRYFQYLLIAQTNSQVGVIRASGSGATASEFNMPFTFSPMRTGPTATYVSGSQTSFTAYSLAGSSSTWNINQIVSTFDTNIGQLQYDGVRIRGGNTGYNDGQPYFGVANSGWIAVTLSAEL